MNTNLKLTLTRKEFFALMNLLNNFGSINTSNSNEVMKRELAGQVMKRMTNKLGNVKDTNKLKLSLGEAIALFEIAVQAYELELYASELELSIISRIRLDFSPKKLL